MEMFCSVISHSLPTSYVDKLRRRTQEVVSYLNRMVQGTVLPRLYAVCLPSRDASDVGGGFLPNYNPMLQFRSGKPLPPDTTLYNTSLTLTHELFHSTNPRAGETDDFWFREGWTTYYAFLIMTRLQYISPEEFFEEMIRKYDGNGYKRHAMLGKKALREVSFHLGRESYLFGYEGGALTAFALDTEIRVRTSNKKSLDDIVRELFQSFTLPGKEYTYTQLVELVHNVTGGEDFAPWFSRYVDGVTSLDFDTILARYGVFVSNSGRVTFSENSSDRQFRDALLNTE